jgi:uncharacterized protein (TIGR02266 family)
VNREFKTVEEFISEYVSNVSETGAFIRTDDPLPVGTRVQLKFTLLLQEIETIEGEGEVVRIVPGGPNSKSGMGVVFTSLSAYSKRLLTQLVTRRPGKA